jgi:hypothetical protein
LLSLIGIFTAISCLASLNSLIFCVSIPEELQFDDWKAPLSRGKIADAVIIAILVSNGLQALLCILGSGRGLVYVDA